ncbi:unnamed protein product [Durusdinium trenchii]|uniref:Uncharacterized protein n=1 Tax=Durusdinium trenchii TaxID=1381693 RepID=A0ABP0KRV6_9DINO
MLGPKLALASWPRAVRVVPCVLRFGTRAEEVKSWVEGVVLQHGFCPWAFNSAKLDEIHYLECSATSQQQVATFLRSEARRLASARPWTTSLVVCREVKEWEDFDAFDAWVLNSMHDLDELVGLVVFHPYFARWPSLAADVVEGRQVTSYYEESDGRKSSKALPATVQCLDPKRVGVRRIGLRFLDDGVVQWVPIEWLQGCGGVPLLDNVLHQAPHPTIHLIRREDLDSVKEGSYGTVASLLRRNSDYLREVDPPLLLREAKGAEQRARFDSLEESFGAKQCQV